MTCLLCCILCEIEIYFPTKSLQIINLAAILDLKIFTNVINKCQDYQYFTWYFQNAFVSTLSKIIWKIHIFNVGHFGLQITALMGKIQGGSWSIWNQRTKIILYTNFYAFIINLNNYALFWPLTSGLCVK